MPLHFIRNRVGYTFRICVISHAYSYLIMLNTQTRNALRILRHNVFISTQANDECVTSLVTLGLLFRENLQVQLRKFDRHCHFPVFPVNRLGECDPLLKQRLLLRNQRCEQENCSPLSDVRSFAFRCNQFVSIEQNRSLWSTTNDKNVANPQQVQRFAIYCSPDVSLNTFHWMQSQRYRFWRSVCILFTFICVIFNYGNNHFLPVVAISVQFHPERNTLRKRSKSTDEHRFQA